MADGWRSFDSAESQKTTKSPWARHDDDDHDDRKTVERTGWGDNLSPLTQNFPKNDVNDGQDPNANGGNGRKPWRAGGNGVAPAAQNMGGEQQQRDRNPFGQRPAPGTDASPPDAQSAQPTPWKAEYPSSTYKGPDASNPAPWNPNPGRAAYPDSTYRGPADAAPPQPAPQGQMDWKQFAEKQMQQPQQGPFAGKDAPGVPSNAGFYKPTDEQRQFVENSLQPKTSMIGYLGTGAITGGLIGGAEWALDRHLLKTMGQPQTGFMGWWQQHSPVLKEQAAYQTRLTSAEELHATRIAEQAIAEDALTASAGRLKTMVSGIDTRVAAEEALKTINLARTGTILDAEARKALMTQINDLPMAQRLLLKQQEFVGAAANITNPTKVAAVIGTETEVASGTKLFVAGTEEAKHLADFAKFSQANTKAVSAVSAAEGELQRSQAMLQESVEGGPGSLVGRSFKGAAKGLGIAGLSLAGGYMLDTGLSKVFGYRAPTTDGMGRFAVDGVAVPAILLSDLPARYKFGLAGAAFVSARASDYFAGTTASVQMSSLLRPNIADGVLITGAAMAPVDGRTKALLVAGAYGIGRLYNGIARLTGLDGDRGTELRDTAVNAFTHDQMAKSESSFDNAIDKAKVLGRENEVALEMQLNDWFAKQQTTSPHDYMRGVAVRAGALGEFRLEEGSRFDLTSHADKKARILKGFNYDFGGEATTFLRMSAGNLVNLQNFVIQNKGRDIDGQNMNDAYLNQLKSEQNKIEQELNKIYGPHDIKGVFNELRNQARVNSGDMQQALVRMKNTFDVMQTNDVRFRAKSARDLTVGYLAEASYMAKNGNGEEARTMYLAAVQYLQESQRLDPSAADNKALDDLQREVAQGAPGLQQQQSIPSAIDSQYKSNFNNPFQLKTPQYPDMQKWKQ